jgi:single-stranded DNA-binding protein
MRLAILDGNIGRDPEIVDVGSLEKLLKFSICNNEKRRKVDDNNWESVPNWYNIEFWTDEPMRWIKKLRVGAKVLVYCDVDEHKWEKDGKTFSRIKFKVRRGDEPQILYYPKNRDASAPDDNQGQGSYQRTQQQQAVDPFAATSGNNEIPPF